MKKWFPLYLVLGLVLTCVGGVSFVDAQNEQEQSVSVSCEGSTICGSPSKEMALMMDFVREMMNSIKTIGPSGPYLGQYVNPNRFEGNRFVPPQQTITSRVVRNLSQKAQFGVAAAAVFATPVNVFGLKDMMGNTVLLGKNKVFLRDNRLVEELESQLSTKKLEIGLGGGWFVPVNADNRAVMNSIIQKYVDLGLLDGGDKSYINDGVLYANVVFLLTQILSSAKTFLYFDSIEQFNNISRLGIELRTIRISFAQGVGENIQADYTCARGFWDVCDTNKKTFSSVWKNMKDIVSDGWKGDQGFMTTIKNANTGFVKTFSPSKAIDYDRFKAREHDLLQSTYGRSERGKFIDVRYDDGGDGQAALDASKNVGKGIVDGAVLVGTTAATAVPNIITTIATAGVNTRKYVTNKTFRDNIKEQKTTQKRAALEEATAASAYDSATVAFENILQSYVQDVFVQQSLDIELATFSEVKDITPAFAKLGSQIAAIRKDVLGDVAQDGSLIKALSDAADLQCSQ